MKYKIIQESSILKLEEKINELLKLNWQLQGGICITYNRYYADYFYSQVITKKLEA